MSATEDVNPEMIAQGSTGLGDTAASAGKPASSSHEIEFNKKMESDPQHDQENVEENSMDMKQIPLSLQYLCYKYEAENEANDDQTASTNGSVTPVLDSTSTSPTSEMSEKSSGKRIQYSREELLMIMDARASRSWPEYFDSAFRKPQGKIDLDKWLRAKQDQHPSSKDALGVSSNNANGPHGGLIGHSDGETKRSRDPKERIKDEQDDIVLSPQRRSFGTGCQVVQPSLTMFNASQETGNHERPREPHREMPTRRVGSGRILRREEQMESGGMGGDRRRDREPGEWESEPRREREYDGRRDWRMKLDNRYERDDRYMDRRRRFFEDDDSRRGGGMRGDPSRRYQDQRRTSYSKEEEEPEWFTGGPSSQNEFIELVGFDGPSQEEPPKPHRERRHSKKDKGGRSSRNSTPVIVEEVENVDIDEAEQNTHYPDTGETSTAIETDQDDIQFNVEDYLGGILNLGSDDMIESEEDQATSRLKKFFKNRESPVHIQGPPSMQRQTVTQVGDLIGFNNPIVRVVSPSSGLDSTRFFAPIAPASKAGEGGNIVQMLQEATSKRIAQPPPLVGSGRLPPPSLNDLLKDGRGQSLEEIEANMRKEPGADPNERSGGLNRQAPQGRGPPNQSVANTPFNDFLLQAQRKNGEDSKPAVVSSAQAKFMNDNNHGGSMGPPPMVPMPPKPTANNATSESDFMKTLMKSGNMNGMLPAMNGPPRLQLPMSGLTISPHLSPTTPGGPGQLSPQSRAGPQFAPTSSAGGSSSDVFMKLMQNQQQQKKQHMMNQSGFQQNQTLNHPQKTYQDPIKQLLGGVNMSMNAGQQQMPSNVDNQRDALIREKIMRPEVQKILQKIMSGQVTEPYLVSQLNSGNLNPQQRDVITTVLKLLHLNIQQLQNTALRPPRATLSPSPTIQPAMPPGGIGVVGGPAISPRGTSPNSEPQNMLTPHMMQQTRLSPLMCSGANGPRRPPSHQELVAHTQSIMQKALLKQELEKAKEKHRKREADRIRSPNPGMNVMNAGVIPVSSPTKGVKCQSPLAFTPTSVMRKMTADKDRIDKVEGVSEVEKAQMDRMQNAAFQPLNKIPTIGSQMPTGNSMLGPRAQMFMSGNPQSNPLMNLSGPPPPPGGPPQTVNPNQQRLGAPYQPQQQPPMSMPRPNQHTMNNIRALQQAQQQQATLNQQMIRNQMPPQMGSANTGLQNRVMNSSSNPVQHMFMGNHNNNYKMGSSGPNQSINLMNLLGRDVFNKVQAGPMPELPGGKVLSLEEVERLQQSRTVPN